jgi:hypothetical protein
MFVQLAWKASVQACEGTTFNENGTLVQECYGKGQCQYHNGTGQGGAAVSCCSCDFGRNQSSSCQDCKAGYIEGDTETGTSVSGLGCFGFMDEIAFDGEPLGEIPVEGRIAVASMQVVGRNVLAEEELSSRVGGADAHRYIADHTVFHAGELRFHAEQFSQLEMQLSVSPSESLVVAFQLVAASSKHLGGDPYEDCNAVYLADADGGPISSEVSITIPNNVSSASLFMASRVTNATNVTTSSSSSSRTNDEFEASENCE